MRQRNAFTLLELLVVVALLGILAAAVLGKFSNVTANARASMLADDLRVMRTQLVVFKAQHLGVSPGYPDCDGDNAPTEDTLVEHITLASTPRGEIAAPGTPGYQYGPYMREMPLNPVNGKSDVIVLADGASLPDGPSDAAGWVYHPASMTFRADCSGTDETGKRYFDY